MLRRYSPRTAWAWGLLLATGMLFGAGCGEQRDPVDRTESLALQKSMFTGEWYYQQTVVDVPGTKTVTTVGNTNYGGMHRIRWDVQRDWLYARKAYEHVQNGKAGDQDTGQYKGAIVGAWRISSHFDIKRDYNTTTGEERNVIVENASDCKWYDCKYFRVDWSQNMATDFMFLDANEDLIKASIPFNDEDLNDPKYKPIFDSKQGYIDVTTSMAVTPGKAYFPSIDASYPLCWFFSNENSECNTEIIKVRNSFMRRHPNRDYEPRRHEGAVTEWFGIFDNQRLNWDPKLGIVNTERAKFMNRHNIWVRSHYDEISCSADDACKQKYGEGSRCDLDIKFFNEDVWTDSDADGLPDSYENTVEGLNPNSADSDGDGVVDQYDDANGNGKADLYDYYVWAASKKEARCTIPLEKRIPVPIAYFQDGDLPRDLTCDHDDGGKDGPCVKEVWQHSNDPKTQEDVWSMLHKVSTNYDNAFWKIFLMGAYGWDYASYKKWIDTRDPNQFSQAQKDVLAKFGKLDAKDAKWRPYASVMCPHNPPLDNDPWPCRFNRKSYDEAKKLADAGMDKMDMRPLIRAGDIRFNQVKYVKDYSDGWRLLGLGPSHTDPRTGENLAGVANIYVLNDWAATRVQEMVQMLQGTLQPGDFINGANIKYWSDYIRQKNARDMQHRRVVTPAQLQTMAKNMTQPWHKNIKKLGSAKEFDAMMWQGKPINQKKLRTILLSEFGKSGLLDPSKVDTDPSILRGTPIERQMVNDPDVLLGSGIDPQILNIYKTGQLPDDIVKRASLARGGFLQLAHAQEEWKSVMSNNLNAFFVGMADNAMVGLAERLKDLPADKIWAKAREIIYTAVLTHELGHTFGLHHNWGGSQDAVNYREEFWRLRTNNFTETKQCNPSNPQPDQLCPFFIKPINDYQLGRDAKNKAQGIKSLYEYAYTSIMDYAGRYTIDGNGLGRYDVAGLMYNHVNKVEVFKDTGTAPATNPNVFDQWHSNDGEILLLYSNRAQGYHYTNWYAAMGDNVWKEENRLLVPVEKVTQVQQNGRDIGFFYQDGNKLMPRVPYVMCTYTRTNLGQGCRTRDYGVDAYEKMQMFIDDMNTWYPIRSFTRYQLGASQWGYISGWLRRYRLIKDFNNIYALYQGLFHQWYDQQQIDSFFADPISGWGDYTLAINDAFNFALRNLAMPDVKGFRDKEVHADGQTLYGEAVFTSAFDTNIVNGRYFTTSWRDTDFNDSCGLQFYQCLHHYGFYIDKIITLYWLAHPATYFVARDTAEDVRQYRISYFNNFQRQLIDFWGSVLSSDYDTHAPWFDPDKPADQTVVENKTSTSGKKYQVEWINGIAQRDYVNKEFDPPKPANGAAVEPATRFTLQMYMAVYGMLMFQGNFRDDFSRRSVMWFDGTAQNMNITPTDDINGTTTFVDPWNGTKYVGIDYKDGRGIAQRMIKRANLLKARSPKCNATAGQPDTCVAGLSTQLRADAEKELDNYRHLMNIVVQMSKVLGWTWNWNPFDP
ncbi:MAG: hypothetical protein KC503_16955 [Myxococcales bacterium]|nr:hypothetical protein [Myxococcales bacterium]